MWNARSKEVWKVVVIVIEARLMPVGKGGKTWSFGREVKRQEYCEVGGSVLEFQLVETIWL